MMKLVCNWCSLEVNLVLNKDYVWVNLEGGLFGNVLGGSRRGDFSGDPD